MKFTYLSRHRGPIDKHNISEGNALRKEVEA
jgi:hypothetical protein